MQLLHFVYRLADELMYVNPGSQNLSTAEDAEALVWTVLPLLVLALFVVPLQLRLFLYHLADKFMYVNPGSRKHPAAEGAELLIWGLLPLSVLALFAYRYGVPENISYLFTGLREPDYQNRALLATGLCLVSLMIWLTLGQAAVGAFTWFKHHFPYKPPIRKVQAGLRWLRDRFWGPVDLQFPS